MTTLSDTTLSKPFIKLSLKLGRSDEDRTPGYGEVQLVSLAGSDFLLNSCGGYILGSVPTTHQKRHSLGAIAGVKTRRTREESL